MNTTNQLTTEELKQLQDLQADFTKSKIALGDLELEKQNVFYNAVFKRSCSG